MTAGYGAAHARAEACAAVIREIAGLIRDPAEDGGLGMADDAALLELRARDLEAGLFKIVVVGEFKNGKSTLLNAMLGNTMLPAKATPSTAIITVLAHGTGERIAVYETGNASPRLIDRDEFVREFQLSREDQETLEGRGTLDRFRDIEYAQIECDHPLCAHGVKLIDSPGLGEHISRTRVATNFLKQAQAVIVVLNATRILSRDEREFIGNLLRAPHQSHVFFVVNRINQLDSASERDVRAWVEQELRPYFLDEAGQPDEHLAARRVFFVDARSALQVRMSAPEDGKAIEQTGVPALEAELERFLTGEEKVLAALQSTAQLVGPVVHEAGRRIGQIESALTQPLSDLEERHTAALQRLDALQTRKSDIERTVLLFGEAVEKKVFGDLRAYVDVMHEDWPEDSRRMIDLDSTTLVTTLLTSFARREARDELAQSIGEQVQRYLRVKFESWTERVPSVIRSDVEMMVAELEAQVNDFQVELDEIASAFSGSPAEGERDRRSGARIMQLALSLSDIGEVTDEVFDPGDWSTMIGRMAQQAVAVLVVGTLVTGGNFLIALVLVEAFHLGLQGNELKRRLREMLGERLHENLREQVEQRRPFIYESVERRFRDLARTLTEVIGSEIDDVRAEQERVLRQKAATHFSIERETARLDSLARRLDELSSLLQLPATPSTA